MSAKKMNMLKVPASGTEGEVVLGRKYPKILSDDIGKVGIYFILLPDPSKTFVCNQDLADTINFTQGGP